MIAAAALIASFLISTAYPGHAPAQPYPTKPIRIVVPFPPGGGSDRLARGFAQPLADQLGQAVLVENRPGAATIIGIEAVAKAAADGYTLLLATNEGLAINPHVYRKLPYAALEDFVPIVPIAQTIEAIVVRTDVPVRNLAELVAHSRAQPGKLNYGTWGIGTLPHLATETFRLRSGADLTHVPFKGAGEAIPGLLGGQVQVLFVAYGILMPHIQAGRIRPLAIFRDQRVPALADVPTVSEAGYPGFESAAWFGMFAPAGTPGAIIERLATELRRAINTPQYAQKFITDLGLAPFGDQTPQQFARMLRAEYERYAREVKAAGIVVDQPR